MNDDPPFFHDDDDARRWSQSMKLHSHIVLLMLLVAVPTFSEDAKSTAEISDHTSCSSAVKAFDNKDKPDMMSVLDYIKGVMYELDQNHTDHGEPGILAQMSDRGQVETAIQAVEHCRLQPVSTIYNAAAFVYVGVRAMEVELGTAK
jgi:hypothetical protein